VDKVAFDMLWFESRQDVAMRQRLRQFYLLQLERHPGSGRGTHFPKYDEISSSSSICHRHRHRLSAVSLRLTAGSDRQPGGWSAPATLDGPVGVASTTTTTKLKLFQT
jgi:hypothetical protein